MRFTDWSSDLCSSDLDVLQGLPAKLWLGAMDSSGSVIADPYLVFEGLTDVAEIDEGGETATISISADNRLIDLERPRTRRYTQEAQQIDDATDLGFEFVPSLQDVEILFGRGQGCAGQDGNRR